MLGKQEHQTPVRLVKGVYIPITQLSVMSSLIMRPLPLPYISGPLLLLRPPCRESP